MTEIEILVETEKIRKLRILYSHYLDSKDLDRLAGLFTEDVICEFGNYGTWYGRTELRARYEEVQIKRDGPHGAPYPTLHVVTNHWVELTGEDSAEGRCYLVDLLTSDPNSGPMRLLGIYDDEYRKVEGEWKIYRTRIDFLWPQRDLLGGAPGRRIPHPSDVSRGKQRAG
jgi:hypothetical protein